MSKNIVKPRTVSFEEALRNLASRLTGRPAADLPRTQEAIVQYMAENVPAPSAGGVNVDALSEAVTKEVMARLVESNGVNPAATEPAETAQDGAENTGGTSTPPAAEQLQEPDQAAQEPPKPPKPKTPRKNNKAKADK